MKRLFLLVAVLLWSVVSIHGQNPHPPSSVHVAAALVPAVGTYGPSSSITCPVGSVSVATGDNLQALVTANLAGTAFCLRSGVHPITSAITPKSGNTFAGEYGAILDGTGWTTSDATQGAFRSHNQDINDVTIRNLVIQNMPKRAIHAFSAGTMTRGDPAGADRWTVEYCELAHNLVGVALPNHGVLRNSYIHHNVGPDPYTEDYLLQGGGYQIYLSTDVLIENNEFAYNGVNQKISLSWYTTWRNNLFHNDVLYGIWMDGENPGTLMEGNVINDEPYIGISYEVSENSTIRNNTIRRTGETAIFISTSHNVQIYGNTLEDNWRGINYFVDCSRLGQGGEIAGLFSMDDDASHDNVIRVPSSPALAYASLFGSSNCTGPQLASYANGSHNLTFTHNTYFAPDLSSHWFTWADVTKTFTQWQALPQDVSGSIALR